MEKLLEECDTKTLHWRTSRDIAEAYLRHGSVVETVLMLRRAEETVDPKSNKLAYGSLMLLYGEAGKAEDVSRIWDMYKSSLKYDGGYRSVINILMKLNDINGARKIFDEWLSCPFNEYDVEIVAMMASAHCKRCQLKDAEEIMRMGVAYRASKRMFTFVVGSMLGSVLVALVYLTYRLVILVKLISEMAFDAITTIYDLGEELEQ